MVELATNLYRGKTLGDLDDQTTERLSRYPNNPREFAGVIQTPRAEPFS